LILLHCVILCNFITFVSSSEILFLVPLSLLYKRLKSTKKNIISLLHLLSQAFALWDGLGNVALALTVLGLGLGLEWSGLVNITAC